MTSVLAFYLSLSDSSGQRVVSFKNLDHDIEILVRDNVFPVDSVLCETNVHVNEYHFRIIFDRHRHRHVRSQASYLFIRIGPHNYPIHLWPENDLDPILEALTLYYHFCLLL
ncbi:hypothetical protein M404DRAFT_29494 [Pisolithus tinctorius Marx 270]|uniref:Uncharacterized protein n=1 Tax=Pisolithus tinctorius Marx 270 TaxID=870435 RepID=A0A0C3IKY2_PISTI|nr:hypothetical protein M404DRAFT_32110 [Pisolithus tinctorius Marx 270]KIO00567.1 hypothetical protein M404DRAFT_29494 [Pisolithus tinctorius Marx 270]